MYSILKAFKFCGHQRRQASCLSLSNYLCDLYVTRVFVHNKHFQLKLLAFFPFPDIQLHPNHPPHPWSTTSDACTYIRAIFLGRTPIDPTWSDLAALAVSCILYLFNILSVTGMVYFSSVIFLFIHPTFFKRASLYLCKTQTGRVYLCTILAHKD